MLLASSSYAKTEDRYIGVDVSRFNVMDKSTSPRNSQISPAFGLNAKYAVNFNNVFIAPGIFAYFNITKDKESGYGYTFNRSVKNCYGIKADLGYDLTDKFVLYATGSFAIVDTTLEITSLYIEVINCEG